MDILKIFRRKAQIPNGNTLYAGGSIAPDMSGTDYLSAYSEIGWLHAVVFRIALGCSEVKWRLYKVSSEKRTQVTKHPVLDLLDKVNPFMTSPEFTALHTIYKELCGESFWIINNNVSGEPGEVVLAYPHKMHVVPAKAFPFVKGYIYGDSPQDSSAVPIELNEVIHFKYPSPLNQYRGLAPVRSIKDNLSAEKYSVLWNKNFFYNSARPDGVIEFDYNLTDEQFEKLRKQWGEKYKGVSKAHQVGLLEGGGKYKQIQNSVKDMDFANLSLRNRDIILGVFGMPLSVMGISENVNKANAEAGDYTFARWIVKPRLDWDKAKLQEQLIPKFRNTDNYEIDFDEVVPETVEQKRDLAESGMRAAYLTINEARKLQGLDPLTDGDVLLIPMNLVPTKIEDITKPRPMPEQPEKPEGEPEGRPAKSFKDDFWATYFQKTNKQEVLFKKVFHDVFVEQKNDVTEYMKLKGELPNDLDNEKVASKFKTAIEVIYLDGFESAGKQFDLLDEIALEWIESHSLELAKNINKTTLEEIRRELKLGYELGESIQKLTARLEQYFNEKEQYRAEMIARTEVIAANNEGALRRFEVDGFDNSEFMAAPDACEECLPLNGQIYVTKDAHGVIPVHPNCRCTWLAVLK